MDENANPENRFEAEMTRKIDLIIQKLGEYDTRFDSVDKRFDSVDKRFDNLEKNVSEIKSVQKEHSQSLKEHSQSLKRLEDKTDSIAEVVVKHEIRITKAEQNIEDLRDGVH